MRKYTSLLLLLLWLPLTLCASANAGSYSADKFYTIAMKSNSSSYISEESDGTLVVTSYDVTKRIFWQFIPTSKANCYYIRNSASGNYIASCNVAQSRASIMKTSSTPVEYYIGTNGNFCRLTSTDCTNYDNTGASPNGLNKDEQVPTSSFGKLAPPMVILGGALRKRRTSMSCAPLCLLQLWGNQLENIC